MKTCTKCRNICELSAFIKDKTRKDGLHPWCSDCQKEKRKKYYKNNKELVLANCRQYYFDNHAKALKSRKSYRERNKESVSASKRRCYESNREHYQNQSANYRLENREKLLIGKKLHYDNNRATYIRKSRLRKGVEVRATPAWADTEEIRFFYDEARRLTQQTGTEHHVDHIIPLQGKRVSGLHVALNLRVITADENRKKQNLFDCINHQEPLPSSREQAG